MTDETLLETIQEYSKFIDEELNIIKDFEKYNANFENDWSEIVKIYSKYDDLISKLNKTTENKILDHEFFGFKYKEEKYQVIRFSGSHELYNDINKAYIEWVKLRSSIIYNPIVLSNEVPFKCQKVVRDGYRTYEREYNIELETKHFVNAANSKSPLMKAINLSVNFYNSQPAGRLGNLNIPSEIKVNRNFPEIYELRVLTKGGAKHACDQKIEIPQRRKRQIELELRSRKRSENLSTELNSIYIFSNKSYSNNTFKIGWTSDDPEVRAEQLSSETGVLHPFKVEYSKKFKDAERVEKKIHKHFSEYRIRKNKEYFELEKDKIIEYIEKLPSK